MTSFLWKQQTLVAWYDALPLPTVTQYAQATSSGYPHKTQDPTIMCTIEQAEAEAMPCIVIHGCQMLPRVSKGIEIEAETQFKWQ